MLTGNLAHAGANPAESCLRALDEDDADAALAHGDPFVHMSVQLAATANDAMMRKLGKRWKTLYTLSYPVAILAVLHYLWLVKQDIYQPVMYALILLGLLSIRILLGLLSIRIIYRLLNLLIIK